MTNDICAIGLSVAIALAPVVPTQALPEWRLRQPLSDAEKTRVLAFAAQLSVGRPAVITGELIRHPLACEALRIESVPTITGKRRTWQRVWVSNTDWQNGCRPVSPESPRLGMWIVADRAGEVGAWRVQDRDGFVDIETPSTIPYADVEAIVRAVKTGNLINRLPPDRGNMPRASRVDAKSIYLIWNANHDLSLYKVWSRTTNVVLLVAVRGTRVELRGWMTEMS